MAHPSSLLPTELSTTNTISKLPDVGNPVARLRRCCAAMVVAGTARPCGAPDQTKGGDSGGAHEGKDGRRRVLKYGKGSECPFCLRRSARLLACLVPGTIPDANARKASGGRTLGAGFFRWNLHHTHRVDGILERGAEQSSGGEVEVVQLEFIP